jgi:TonB-dependent starch-binding outer membrane protein SusC
MEMSQQPVCSSRSTRARRGSRIRLLAGAIGGLLALLLINTAPAAAQSRVEGRVSSAASGEGLAGVQVVLQGTGVGTRTDTQGRYTLNVPNGQGTLLFSTLGYVAQTAPINGRSVIDVRMAAQVTGLEGVVVVGYGQKTRPTVTESIGTVEAAQIQKVTVASADQAIQGRVPGVQVTTESGVPGAPVAIRIRGVGTVGNTQPLFVVDGVPVGKGTAGTASPLTTINPNDIESISVLKDASAASLYGMQAANGVVLIQTRRGKLGKPTIRYDGYTGVQQMPNRYDLNDATAWLALEREAMAANNQYFNRVPGTPAYLLQHPDLRDGSPVLASLLARNTDWTRVGIHDNAPIINHNVAISGASEAVNYFISGGYFQQDAIVQKWDLTRYTFRANSDFNITDRLRVGESFTLSNQPTLRGAGNYGDGTILNNLLSQPPIFLAYDPALVSPTNPQGLTGNFQTGGFTRANLNSTNQLQDVTDRTSRLLGGVHAEFDPIDGLTLRTQNSVDYAIRNQYVWQPGFTNEMTGFARPEIAEDIRGEDYTLVSTNTANYTNSLGSHNFDLLAGVETNLSHGNSLSLQTTNFVNQEYELRRIPALGDQLLKKGGGAGEQNRLGYFGRINYNFADRYLFTASVRRDGVSTFAPGNQWGTFPAFSAGWRVSEEPFFNVDWVDELKLRGSWGQLGNSDLPGGGAYPQYVAVNLWAEYQIGNTIALAPTPRPSLANPDLSWETNETSDFGFETSLFGNLVDFAATYYQRDTKNFLLNIPVPVLSGFTSAPVNVGSMRNSGFEFEAGYNTVVRDEVELGLSANLTTVKNRLQELTEGVEQYSQQDVYRTAVGQPVGYFFGYKTCGVHQTDAAAAAVKDNTTGANQPRAGDMCFQDLRGPYKRDADGNLVETPPDGLITTDDRDYLGKTIPDMYYGINLNAAFRRLDLTAFFNGVKGVQAYNAVRRSLESMSGGGSNQLATTANRWTPTNPSNTMPRAIQGDPAGNNRFSDRWVEDSDFFRLKTIQLGFTLPDRLLGSPAMGSRIYVSASNLWTLTDYSGLDPEFTTRGNAFNQANNQSQLGAGTDDGNIPQPRMFQIGVSTSF